MNEETKMLADKVDGEIKDKINSWLELTQDPAMVSALLVKNASMMSIAFCSNGHAVTANLLNAFLAPVEAYLEAEAEVEDEFIEGEASVAEEGFETRPKGAQVH